MNNPLRQVPVPVEIRRPVIPAQVRSSSLFLGWGPKF